MVGKIYYKNVYDDVRDNGRAYDFNERNTKVSACPSGH